MANRVAFLRGMLDGIRPGLATMHHEGSTNRTGTETHYGIKPSDLPPAG